MVLYSPLASYPLETTGGILHHCQPSLIQNNFIRKTHEQQALLTPAIVTEEQWIGLLKIEVVVVVVTEEKEGFFN